MKYDNPGDFDESQVEDESYLDQILQEFNELPCQPSMKVEQPEVSS